MPVKLFQGFFTNIYIEWNKNLGGLMSDKDVKISELEELDELGVDYIPVSTGLELGGTPDTKKINREALKMSPGGYAAYRAIMALNPVHYWPMDGGPRSTYDAVTGRQTGSNFSIAIAVGPTLLLSAKAPRNLGDSSNSSAGGVTDINWMPPSNFSIHLLFNRFDTTSININLFGNDSLYPIRISSTSSVSGTGRIQVVAVRNGVSLTLQGAAGTGAKDRLRSVLYTFSSSSGHRVYVNGAQVAASSNVALIDNPTEDIILQRSTSIFLMQDLAIFNQTLTQTDAENLAALFAATGTTS
jgi:hypothetical protein